MNKNDALLDRMQADMADVRSKTVPEGWLPDGIITVRVNNGDDELGFAITYEEMADGLTADCFERRLNATKHALWLRGTGLMEAAE